MALAATRRVWPMKMFWKASWVPEAAVRTTRSIGPACPRARHLAPAPDPAREDVLDLRLAEGRDRVGRVGDDADRVAGDFVEDDSARVGGFGVARGHPERDAAARDIGDADVGAALEDHELDLALVLGCLTKAFASFVASGAIEVDPLIVIVAAEAEATAVSDRRGPAQRRGSNGGCGSFWSRSWCWFGSPFRASVESTPPPKVNAT